MQLAFLDESYNEDFYFIAAVMGDEHQWAEASARLQGIRDDAANKWPDVAEDVEFHAHEILGGSGGWKPLRGKHFEAASILGGVLEAAQLSGLTAVVRGINVARLRARYRYPDPPAKLGLQHVLERVDAKVRATSDTVAVVADEVDSAAQHMKELDAYRTDGTPGYRPTRLLQIESLKFMDSKASDGLQVVDAFAYTYHRNHSCESGRVSEDRRARRLRMRLMSTVDQCCWEHGIWHP